jgi:hypothetical protein
MCIANQASAQSGSRPFDDLVRRPSVSPYLNLINQGDQNNPNNFNSNVARYQNLVQPQLESFNRNIRTQSQIRGLQNQIQQVQTTAIGAVSNTTQMGFQGQGFTTGHPSLFRYYSRYYPALNR